MITSYMDKDRVRGYKVKLYPTEQQKMRLNQLMNGAICAYNWGIETIQKVYKETNKFSDTMDLNKYFKELYKTKPYYWVQTTPSSICRTSFELAARAFKLFFKHVNRYPKFKSTKKAVKSFHFRGERLYIRGDYVTVEGLGHGLANRILCKHNKIPIYENVRYYNCTVSIDSVGDYWLSVNVGYKVPIRHEAQGEPIGIDLGVRKRAVLSDGTVFKGPDQKKLNKLRSKYRKKSKRYGRDRRRRLDISQCTGTKYKDVVKTKNEVKRERECRRIRKKISNINNTYNHTMTKQIVSKLPSTIVLESLDVRGMIRDQEQRAVRGLISESNFYGIVTMLSYKAEERGIKIIRADPHFPSSQICSKCGARHKQSSSEIYRCRTCGFVIDRDLNAAINLKNLA